jgi:hypothetical protein
LAEQDSRDVDAVIRTKLLAGTLPSIRPSQIWAGESAGAICDACDQAIALRDVEYEANFVDGGTFRFHRRCFDVWHQQRAEQTPPPISGGSGSVQDVTFALLYGANGLCVECIAAKVARSADRVAAILGAMSTTVLIYQTHAECVRCQREVEVFSLT